MQLSVAKKTGEKEGEISVREPSVAATELLKELMKEPRLFRNELSPFVERWSLGGRDLGDRENNKTIAVWEACLALIEATRVSLAVNRDLENSWENLSYLANLSGGRLFPPVLAALRQSLKGSDWLTVECARAGSEMPTALKDLVRKAQEEGPVGRTRNF